MAVLAAFCFSLVADGQKLKVSICSGWLDGYLVVVFFPKECTNVGADVNILEKYRSVLLDYCM